MLLSIFTNGFQFPLKSLFSFKREFFRMRTFLPLPPDLDRKPAARKKGFRRRAKLQFNSKKGKLPYTSNIRSP